MSSATAAPRAVLGAQAPRLCAVPPAQSSAGQEVIELAQLAGLELDPWQQFVLDRSLGERVDGQWAAFEVGLVCQRQNGKGGILEARELGGLFLLGEQLITHSAHQFDTSLEAFSRLLALIEQTPDLDRRVQRVSRSHGEEGITLKGGQRIRFRTRTKGGGRGFSGDCVILDEAMELPETALGALFPTLSARPNPQIWYTGTAVDQEIHDHGVVLARVRERGHRGDDPKLAYFEWSIDADSPDDVTQAVARDPEAWAQANPALGIRITPDYIAAEQRALAHRTFAVERLGVGDWPSTDNVMHVIPLETWQALADPGSTIVGPVSFAFDVTPDRSRAAISAAGTRRDGLRHVEVIEHRRGTDWLPDRLQDLTKTHDTAGASCDGAGPAASLLPALQDRKVEVTTVTAKEHAQACGHFYDTVDQAAVRHLGTAEMDAAIQGAVKRSLGDAWAWSRKSSNVDISPLVASTLALWGAENKTPELVPLVGRARR
jgi:hypothetical protein